MSDNAKQFLGTGWKFPVSVDPNTGRILTSGYEEDIQEAIRIIIMTKNGERMMRPDFGCRIYEHVFDGMEYTSVSEMEREVKKSLILWEPRITDVEVRVEMTEAGNAMLIHVSYVVRATNNPYNLVYPYYITEGQE